LPEVLAALASQGGLLGVSGVSGDVRDLHDASAQGNERARLAIDMFVSEIRRYLGAMLVELGGADVIAFTGGIGENDHVIRAAVCDGLEELGIQLDPEANRVTRSEARICGEASRVQVWVIPTNEELIVARQSKELLEG
jgi:acetate kinase